MRQAAVAIDVLQLFAEELLASRQWKLVQEILRSLYYVARDDFVRGRFARHHEELNPLHVMKAFISHDGLEPIFASRLRHAHRRTFTTSMESQKITADSGHAGNALTFNRHKSHQHRSL